MMIDRQRFTLTLAPGMVAAVLVCLVLGLSKSSASANAAELPNAPLGIIIFEVDKTGDENDGSCAVADDCSLRDAILLANATSGNKEIDFNIAGCVGVCSLTFSSALPTLTGGNTTIDGYSQPGTAQATASTPATLLIELNGTGVNVNGLNVTSANNTIKGLVINRFYLGAGISLWGSGAYNNVVEGNYLGTDPTGAIKRANLGGVVIGATAHNNTIGGTSAADRNLISGNSTNGVYLGIELSSVNYIAIDNAVTGNYIGTTASGSSDLGNAYAGVYIHTGSYSNTLDSNLISGNDWDGVYIHSAMTNTVSGNLIGVDETGLLDLGNTWHGVRLDGGSQYNTIGGDTEAERNIISGNGPAGEGVYPNGVKITGSGTMSNTVSGNYIGLDVNGTSVISNTYDGVLIEKQAQYNLVGGDSSAERNVISGNSDDGVKIDDVGTMHNTVSANYIGTDATGMFPVGNGDEGVYIGVGPQYNIIGGDSPGERNVISGNGRGVTISGSDTMNNTVSGNFIGVNRNGTLELPNSSSGVWIIYSPQNTIGGDSPGERNIISGNESDGVYIFGDDSYGNTVIGNFIGTDVTGTARIRNGGCGIHITVGAYSNTIGGSAPGEGNVISGNTLDGVYITDDGSDGNTLVGNLIGTDPSGTLNLYNGYEGVYITLGASNNTVGPGNIIAYNENDGVYITEGASNNTVGPGKIIAYNEYGVSIDIGDTEENDVTQNSIFSNDNMGINLWGNANGNIQPPVILTATLGSVHVSGTACPNCIVELFENPDDDGEGKYYLGSDIADISGDFTVTVSRLAHPYLTATATDVISGTSEFSAVYESTIRSLFLPLVLR